VTFERVPYTSVDFGGLLDTGQMVSAYSGSAFLLPEIPIIILEDQGPTTWQPGLNNFAARVGIGTISDSGLSFTQTGFFKQSTRVFQVGWMELRVRFMSLWSTGSGIRRSEVFLTASW